MTPEAANLLDLFLHVAEFVALAGLALWVRDIDGRTKK